MAFVTKQGELCEEIDGLNESLALKQALLKQVIRALLQIRSLCATPRALYSHALSTVATMRAVCLLLHAC